MAAGLKREVRYGPGRRGCVSRGLIPTRTRRREGPCRDPACHCRMCDGKADLGETVLSRKTCLKLCAVRPREIGALALSALGVSARERGCA